MIRFILAATVLALVFPGVAVLAHKLEWIRETPSFLYETTWLVALTTAIIFIYLYRSGNGNFFVQLYLLSMVLKLITYFAYNLIMIQQDTPGARVNVVYFLLVYSVFTAIEIAFLYRKISPPSGS